MPASSGYTTLIDSERGLFLSYVYPLDTRKLLYAGGAVVGVILVAVVWSSLSSSGDNPTPDHFKGSSILSTAPLIVGSNFFPTKLQSKPVLNFDFENVSKDSQTDITRLQSGFVSSQIWSINVSCNAMYKDAVALTLEQLDTFSRLIDKYPTKLDLVLSSKVMKESSVTRKKVGSLLAISSSHSMDGRLAVLRTFKQLGVRVMALASDCKDPNNATQPWAPSYLDSNKTGLSEFGKIVVKEMNRLGIVIDLSQASHQTQLDVLDVTKAPVIFSHTAAYGIVNESRNIQDDVLEKLKINNGVVMVTFVQKYLSADPNTNNFTVLNVVDHINYIKKKIGVNHIGIGGEFDAQDQKYPSKLNDVSTFPNLFDNLTSTWTNPDDLKLLAGGNLLRVLSTVEKYAETANLQVEETFELQVNSTCYSDYEGRKSQVLTTSQPPATTPTTVTTPSTTVTTPNATVTTVSTTTPGPATNATAATTVATTAAPVKNQSPKQPQK